MSNSKMNSDEMKAELPKKTLIEQGYELCQQSVGFSDHIGPFYQKKEGDSWIRAIEIEQHHLNPEGVVHGGLVLSFMDYVCYRAIGDEIGHQIKFATINLNSNFIAAAKVGDIIYGQGKIVKKTRSIIFAEGNIFTEQRPIMTASGLWKIIGA